MEEPPRENPQEPEVQPPQEVLQEPVAVADPPQEIPIPQENQVDDEWMDAEEENPELDDGIDPVPVDAQQPQVANPLAEAEAAAALGVLGLLRQPIGGRIGRRGQGRLRRRRPTYTEAQKRRAVELLDMGLSCRTVAATLGPHCSSGTPIRWRKKFRAAENRRLGLAAVIREAGMQQAPLPNEINIPPMEVNRPVVAPPRPGPAPRIRRPRRRRRN